MMPRGLRKQVALCRWIEPGVEDGKNRFGEKTEEGKPEDPGDREETTVAGAGDSRRKKRRTKVLGRTEMVDV